MRARQIKTTTQNVSRRVAMKDRAYDIPRDEFEITNQQTCAIERLFIPKGKRFFIDAKRREYYEDTNTNFLPNHLTEF